MIVPRAAGRGKVHITPRRRRTREEVRRVVARLVAAHPDRLTTADRITPPMPQGVTT